MIEPLGTRVNLRDMLTPEGRKAIKKGDYLNFRNESGEITCVRVIRAGFIRYEGEIVERPKTEKEILAANELAEEQFAAEAAKNVKLEDVTSKIEVIKKPKRKVKKDGI